MVTLGLVSASLYFLGVYSEDQRLKDEGYGDEKDQQVRELHKTGERVRQKVWRIVTRAINGCGPQMCAGTRSAPPGSPPATSRRMR